MTVIEEAAKSHPNSWWWLKADGCNLNKGLKESARGQWSGDVDLNDGSLQKQYESYKTRLEVAAKVGLKGGKEGALKDLNVVKDEISKDIQYVTTGMKVDDLLIVAYINFCCFCRQSYHKLTQHTQRRCSKILTGKRTWLP